MFTASGAISLSSQSVRVLMSLRHIVIVEYYVQASGGNSTKQCGNQPTAFALVLFCCIFFFFLNLLEVTTNDEAALPLLLDRRCKLTRWNISEVLTIVIAGIEAD